MIGSRFRAGVELIRDRYNTKVASDPNGDYAFDSLTDFLTNHPLSAFYAAVYFSGDRATPSGTGAPLASAGVIMSTATTSRQIQLALRPVW
jgi:hypothetical protein